MSSSVQSFVNLCLILHSRKKGWLRTAEDNLKKYLFSLLDKLHFSPKWSEPRVLKWQCKCPSKISCSKRATVKTGVNSSIWHGLFSAVRPSTTSSMLQQWIRPLKSMIVALKWGSEVYFGFVFLMPCLVVLLPVFILLSHFHSLITLSAICETSEICQWISSVDPLTINWYMFIRLEQKKMKKLAV